MTLTDPPPPIQHLADAAMASDADTVRRLLDSDPTLACAYTDDGWTAVHLAATPEIARMLLEAGADIRARNRHRFAGPGNSPLHGATYLNRPDVVRFLLARGADPNAGDNAGLTALHLAAGNGWVECARELLIAGADANAKTNDNGVPKQWRAVTPLDVLSATERNRDDGTAISPEADAEMAALLRAHANSQRH